VYSEPKCKEDKMPAVNSLHTNYAAAITKAASKQTYYTVRFLVDKNLVEDAYKAYAYFRWVDDCLDQNNRPRADCKEFVSRQERLMNNCFKGIPISECTPEEQLLVDLITKDADASSGLQSYIRNMMAVMVFDTNRRGHLVSQHELTEYTHNLAVAVTEALHYFIGNQSTSRYKKGRYQAAAGAHIAHMLRDALEDSELGYYNIPREVVAASGITPWDSHSPAYREWVRKCVGEARRCFQIGRIYLSQVENLRCRIAGYAYIHRFEIVLDLIEAENYLLRADYPERKSLMSSTSMISNALWMALTHQPNEDVSVAIPT